MMLPESHSIWLNRAEHDWRAIRAIEASHERSWPAISFHAQQAAEKTLKAFLAYHKVKPPRTHDLEGLLDACISYDTLLGELRIDANFLTQFAVAARYFEVEDEFSEESGQEAIAAAKRLCAAIQERIK
ncbi:MAG TPA: HEPN domain-containing protein [Candidatus Kapabacteria bacterium]|nr:HEPN domain-containing protein [Candidatus Kapabacteria bacterium]